MFRPAWRVAKAIAALLVAAVLLAAVGAQTSSAADFELWVVFHENHTITLTFADGTPVGTISGAGPAIAPGSYTLHFDDSVGVEGPSFTIGGPGVILSEDLYFGESPSATHRVNFAPSSTYTWRNDEQPNVVFSFTTSNAAPGGSSGGSSSGGSSTTTKTTTSQSKDLVGSKVVATRGTLSGDVSTKGKLTLVFGGKKVASLKAGKYKLSVLDETSQAAFFVQKQGAAAVKVTGATFVGRHAVTVTLKAGQWFFYSKPAKKSYFVVVG